MIAKRAASLGALLGVLLATPAWPAAKHPPSAAAAKAFTDHAEADLAAATEYLNRAEWVRNTYITDDTNWLMAKASSELTDRALGYAKAARAFEMTRTDPVTRRKLHLLESALELPAPSRPGASRELADLATRNDTRYSTGRVNYQGRSLTLDDMEDILRTSRDPSVTKALWEGWRTVSPPMAPDYARVVALTNEGAREMGYHDTGALWRSWYDMDPDAFAAKTDALWRQVEPLYRDLHCYVRRRLNERYGAAVQPPSGPIRADLTGDMWAQNWSNIYDVVAPSDARQGDDLTAALVRQGYTPERMIRTGEAFFTSLGFAPLPDTFWRRSQIVRPRDREVVCHAEGWDVDNRSDVRLKACITITADDFSTAHHELGHNIYQRAYQDQPFLFRNGANDGFHEAIGDFAALNAMAPSYLETLGLLGPASGAQSDIPELLKVALDKVAFLPFGLMVDRWRWDVFAGKIAPADYNRAWWALALKYQAIAPPGERPADAFDPGAKYHVADNTPYTRYFLAIIYQFQFYRAACRQAGWTGPLNKCSVYGDKAVGRRLGEMLAMGNSRPWPEALKTFTGEDDLDAGAITEYFAPLQAWLRVQNKGAACGAVIS